VKDLPFFLAPSLFLPVSILYLSLLLSCREYLLKLSQSLVIVVQIEAIISFSDGAQQHYRTEVLHQMSEH
jgi:hypothetical protein